MRCTNRKSGFTLVEVVAIVTITSVLAAFAVPRLIDRTAVESRGFYDAAQSMVRYAQKTAVAQRRSTPHTPIYVVIAGSGIRICYDAGCTTPVNDASTGEPLQVTAPTGVTVTPDTTFSFDGAGAPSVAAQLAVNVQSSGIGDVNRTFYIEPYTGYVHD